MDTPAPTRGRGRGGARKRHTIGARSTSTSQKQAADSADHFTSSLGTPAASLPSSSHSRETPSPSASRGTRSRARNADGTFASPEDPDSKGGRSLRKRARVDYTFEQADEDVSDATKTTPCAGRALKKRRTDTPFNENEADEDLDARLKRGSSEQLPPPPATRRRNQPRRSTIAEHTQPHLPNPPTGDKDVQDTIEVGGHHSEESDGSFLRRTTSGSSNGDYKSASKSVPSDSLIPDLNHLGRWRPRNYADPDESSNGDTDIRNGLPTLPPAPEEHEEDRYSYEHLTPYVDGTVYYPLAQPENGAEAEPDVAQEDAPEDDVAVEDPVDGAAIETPAESPVPGADTTANSPVSFPEIPAVLPPIRKPVAFKKTRDASDFTQLFDDTKAITPMDLWRRLEIANRALLAYQQEYNELRKITDDEDNSLRYHQEEAAFQHRRKMAISKDPDANPIRKDFVVKGTRAPKPDPYVAYQKQQDRIMANAYLFDYDDREIKVGQQDPLGQRGGLGKGRLRDRPKQTAKAAEADDPNVVHGKRTRKAPQLFDGSEATSRGSTPMPAQRRRRRGGQTVEENGDATLAIPRSSEPLESVTPKKKGKGGRPRKHPLPVSLPEEPPEPVIKPEVEPEYDQIPEPEPAPQQKPTRKRRRKAAAEDDEAVPNGDDSRVVHDKPPSRRGTSRFSEVPSTSFYTTSSMPSNHTQPDESRPATSSSTATVSTVASNYQLREKRQKKFTVNESDDDFAQEPRPKRARRPTKKTQGEDLAPAAMHQAPIPVPTLGQFPTSQPDVDATSYPHKPPTKIKIKNYHPANTTLAPTSAPASNSSPLPPSSTPTPSHASNGNGISNGIAKEPSNGTDGSDGIKDYSQMTKAEKMSHSMKARWASGSMSGAVAKRRETLALKKQTGRPTDASPAPETGGYIQPPPY
ncbi:hypothetical protein F4780DRAFT_215035 [Xylariomycetidae sp. FL0641]|nr:hypothetical protein F4780DRAFT_215035 [Xylariomycetidae sp. FL0641]